MAQLCFALFDFGASLQWTGAGAGTLRFHQAKFDEMKYDFISRVAFMKTESNLRCVSNICDENAFCGKLMDVCIKLSVRYWDGIMGFYLPKSFHH